MCSRVLFRLVIHYAIKNAASIYTFNGVSINSKINGFGMHACVRAGTHLFSLKELEESGRREMKLSLLILVVEILGL